MIEIAISLAVIGFALVAIIGILPMGLNVQKDNREDTIVTQDAQYFIDLIRFGRQGRTPDQGKALDFLTNYVESITITKIVDLKTNSQTFTFNQAPMTNGQVIMDLLCTPRYESFMARNGVLVGIATNIVTANVRAMGGSALEQNQSASSANGTASQVAFKYQMDVQLVQYSTTPLYTDYYSTNLLWANPNSVTNPLAMNQLHMLQNNLMELRVMCSWPLLPNGKTGPNKRHFRSMISGQLHRARDGSGNFFDADPGTDNFHLYYIDPQSFVNATNIGTNTLIN